MRRVGCSCEVPKTGFWDVGSLPEPIAEKLDFDFGWRSVHRCDNRLVFSTGFRR
jgi:hypothetical protein